MLLNSAILFLWPWHVINLSMSNFEYLLKIFSNTLYLHLPAENNSKYDIQHVQIFEMLRLLSKKTCQMTTVNLCIANSIDFGKLLQSPGWTKIIKNCVKYRNSGPLSLMSSSRSVLHGQSVLRNVDGNSFSNFASEFESTISKLVLDLYDHEITLPRILLMAI